MRKLSEISGTEGLEIIGRLFPLFREAIRKAGNNTGDGYAYLGHLLESAPNEIIEILSVIDNVPIEEYKKKSFLELMRDVSAMIEDADLMGLFGLQMQKKTSSTSASGSSEVKK